MVRQGTDDELSSSPADRDARARAGTMTGSNLAVSGKAAWFGTSTARESRRMVRAGTSPDEELAVTGLRIFRADSGHSFSYSLPRLRIAGPLLAISGARRAWQSCKRGSSWTMPAEAFPLDTLLGGEGQLFEAIRHSSARC